MDMMGKEPVGINYVLPTGKYKGYRIMDVLTFNAPYIEWAARERILILDKKTYARMKEAIEVHNVLWAKTKPDLEKALDILRKRVERKIEANECRRQDKNSGGSKGDDDEGREKRLPTHDSGRL